MVEPRWTDETAKRAGFRFDGKGVCKKVDARRGSIDFTADRKSGRRKRRARARARARVLINNRDTPRSFSRSRLSADNGRPRVFAALITVSNAECGKKDGDECAAELVTDGGSGDPLCQSRESPIAESLAPPAKQQSAKQQSAHTRHIAHRGRHISRGRIPRSRAPARFVKLAGGLTATATRNHVAAGMQIRTITGGDAAISRSGFSARPP